MSLSSQSLALVLAI